MARGFGTTDGVATTDKLTTTYAANSTLLSFSIWAWRTGAGGSTFGRLFDKNSGVAGTRLLTHDSVNATYRLLVDWTTDGEWTIVEPSAASWHHICVVYDGTVAGTVPVIYVNGVSVTVTTSVASAGTLVTGAAAYAVGNRADDTRNWNGRLAEFAIWNRLLSVDEAAALGKGFTPGHFPNGLVHYTPINGRSSPERDQYTGATVTVVGTLYQDSPRLFLASKPRYDYPAGNTGYVAAISAQGYGKMIGLRYV